MVDDLARRSSVPPTERKPWTYAEAFARNRGLINRQEQEHLRNCRVAIAGMGGVGGIHLITLARLGIGGFRIADPDTFDVANFNRQYGARLGNLGANKAEVMGREALSVNPDLDLKVLAGALTRENVGEFLDGADVFLDGIDYFSIDARRMLFAEARRRGIWALTAGPMGFSTAWLAFDPRGMSFDAYFDLRDGMAPVDKLAAFTVGLTPRATHWGYFDMSEVDQQGARGPSLALACNLASGMAAAEIAKIILKRGSLRPAPCFAQFDAYRCILRKGRLRWGNRHPWQRIKRIVLARRLRQMNMPQLAR